WGVALIAAFLLNRRHDLAYLPGWLARDARELAAHPTLGSQGLLQSFGGAVVAVLLLVAWWGLGRLVRRNAVGRMKLGSRALEWGVACLLGAGAWSTIWLLVGLMKLYRPSVAVAALGVGLALAVSAWRREETISFARAPRPWLAIALIALVTVLTLT